MADVQIANDSKSSLVAQLNDDQMSLEDKLSAIEEAMAAAQAQAAGASTSTTGTAAPVDPQDFLMCDSCQ